MDPVKQKILKEALKLAAKIAFTGIAYGLIAKVWRW